MNCHDFTSHLDDILDDSLAPSRRLDADMHARSCASCRALLEGRRALLKQTGRLPRTIEPDRELWSGIRAVIESESGGVRHAPAPRPSRLWHAAFAAAAVIAVCAGLLWFGRSGSPSWSVSTISGTPRVANKRVAERADWRVGQWLETDATSSAEFDVGSIGQVRLEPNSRIRLVDAAPSQHRLELVRGTMHALIWAPPRLFFVETPAATAIDLGCAYTLEVENDGTGTLHVTSGYVALEDGDREAIIPAGMMCLMRPSIGPGTPFVEDAPEAFREALLHFDFGDRNAAALDTVLALSSLADVVTLWHLIARVSADEKRVVVDRLAGLSPPPEGVSRDGVLAGDHKMLDRWAVDLGLVGDFARVP